MAHFSGDAGLSRIFAATDAADPFAALAAGWLGVPLAQVGGRQGAGARMGAQQRACAPQSGTARLQARGDARRWHCWISLPPLLLATHPLLRPHTPPRPCR